MLGNPADAEDQLQEIFLSAHRKLDSFRGESALGTWLYRLGMNRSSITSAAARRGRASHRRPRGCVAAGGRGGHRLADRAIDRIDLERALAELPEGCRAAFVLHDVEGLEHKEFLRCSASRRARRSRRSIRRG